MSNRWRWPWQRRERTFPGGIYPAEMKTCSTQLAIATLPLPERFIIPLRQHQGDVGACAIQVGDTVLRGQPLTRGDSSMLPVHAPTSGKIISIAPHISAHPSGLAELAITLQPDSADRWIDRPEVSNLAVTSRAELLLKIHQAGIAGLGGAGFPSAQKLSSGQTQITTLIINAAECEPYITADDCLMQAYASDILQGILLLERLVGPQRILLGIEDNKPRAISALRAAFAQQPQINICVVPTKYPSGGARQLIYLLTGQSVPPRCHATDIGIVMLNVATVWAIKRAIYHGEALTERVVTLSGGAVTQPRNFWVRIGTPVSHLLAHGAGIVASNPQVVMGGPLMGFTLTSLDVPIIKTTNCILLPSVDEWPDKGIEQPCIRCGACAEVCPAELLPQQLYWFSRSGCHDKAQAYNLHDCIECGACAWVCPSAIPLVQYYRQEKAELRAIANEAARASSAKARFNAKQARLAREKTARQTRHTQAMIAASARQQQMQPDEQAMPPANAAPQPVLTAPAPTGDQCDKLTSTPVFSLQAEARKHAVAAAIARAKAKKTIQQKG